MRRHRRWQWYGLLAATRNGHRWQLQGSTRHVQRLEPALPCVHTSRLYTCLPLASKDEPMPEWGRPRGCAPPSLGRTYHHGGYGKEQGLPGGNQASSKQQSSKHAAVKSRLEAEMHQLRLEHLKHEVKVLCGFFYWRLLVVADIMHMIRVSLKGAAMNCLSLQVYQVTN